MSKIRTPKRRLKTAPIARPAQESKPSAEIIRLLNLLRSRIASLLGAKNDAEFTRLQDGVWSSTASCREIESILDEPFDFQGTKAPLYEIYRKECMLAGSLDSDAIVVMLVARDAFLQARQSAWGITAPSKAFEARENEKAAREAEQILVQAATAVKTCAAGSPFPLTDDRQRVHFDDESLRVTIDGLTSAVDDPIAYRLFKAIAEVRPNRITARKISEHTKLSGKKWSRELKKLPGDLRNKIQCNTAGFCCILPSTTRPKLSPVVRG